MYQYVVLDTYNAIPMSLDLESASKLFILNSAQDPIVSVCELYQCKVYQKLSLAWEGMKLRRKVEHARLILVYTFTPIVGT